MTTTQDVLDRIAAERLYQVSEFGGAKHDAAHSSVDWVSIITIHLGHVASAAYRADYGDDEEVQDALNRFSTQLVKVAALCSAAIEATENRR